MKKKKIVNIKIKIYFNFLKKKGSPKSKTSCQIIRTKKGSTKNTQENVRGWNLWATKLQATNGGTK